jgi:transcriptional regulator with XRE-family HTH domain
MEAKEKDYVMRISEVMKEKGVTTKELSEKTGILVTAINEYRSARKKEPTLYRGLLIADALGVSPWELIEKKK